MNQEMARRVQKMFLGDVIWACCFVAVLWAVIGYVFLRILGLSDDGGVHTVLAIGGGLVLVFNTAAIVAMVRHYSHEKAFIYGLDIRHLDESRAARAARASQRPAGTPAQARTSS